MAPFSKPETVLKQAEGLVSVGQTHAALQSLTEMFSSKRFRSTPLTSLEPIMFRFIELCVDMRKGRSAKEGLMQYKNIAQNTSVQSIEVVITRFVQLADAKVQEAQEKAAATQVALDVDDLEASETPESILLGAVSGDQSKDRTDRALVTPWLKFLWEAYRTSLETLKNNARLEAIYQQIAQQAFKFCLKHQRKVEFRRLCDTLRLHLANVAKYSHQPHSINLSDPDTLQHHLDTRFAQLNTSVELELWQEAFRSVEDVHNLLTLAKKAPRPAMMANYYEKLTKIFLMSGNALYHAAAWGRYYSIVSSIGGKTEEEMSKLAGQVLVSALAVPVGLQSEAQEDVKGRPGRLSSLLGLSKAPTRAGLIKDALARDVLRISPADVKQLYDILEVTFNPLTLCEAVTPLLTSLSADTLYASYLPLLHQAVLSRLLSQLSQVYTTMQVSNLLKLAEPLGAFDPEQIEAYMMGCARRGELNIRVDHLSGSIKFIDDGFVVDEGSAYGPEGAIQPAVSELVRTRLSSVAQALHNTISVLDSANAEPEEDQDEKLSVLVKAIEAERKALTVRRALVAKRRELSSELSVRKEKEESIKAAEIARKKREEEIKKEKENLAARERERIQKERESIQKQEAEKYAQSLIKVGTLKADDLSKLEKFDSESILSMQVQQLEKEKRETAQRVRIISKRIDHIERAYRKEERPLVAEDYKRQQEYDRETHNTIQESNKTASKAAHEEALLTKKRVSRMLSDYNIRRDALLKKKGEDFAKRKDAAARKIEEEKNKRRKAYIAEMEAEKRRYEEEERIRREEEEEQARLEEERAAEEERIRAEEEAAAAAAEEEKRASEAKAAEARREREAERAAAAESARLQRQREEEAEARRAAARAERARPSAPPSRPVSSIQTADGGSAAWRRSGTPVRAAGISSPAPARPESPAGAPARYRPPGAGAPGGGGGGWRDREAARMAAGENGGGSGAATPVRSGTPVRAPEAPVRSASPAVKASEAAKDEDGFQTVAKPQGVWKPRRGGRP
ncbi:hypothetical protein CYLTODRAFT_492209 [Cylindrobasidium torrendii FP15055 ss-10]|uniref:Eukaryotic translation initiation factor 3 subunit A n=1 Tax=Cylindrobasidium torrendii FP15055 ss-10 TaxID=1314674 RepID=A0A0D7B4Q6_9AGAR|nr:hypothetical protein CYLTODRAFT_492209 [Cylindrobasidium torrendii FP15055 ss-10]